MGARRPHRAGAGPLERCGTEGSLVIELTRRDEFALLRLDRPEALNALSFALIRDIGAALDEVAATDARALLITGGGEKAFCAGADIKELTQRGLLAQRQGAEAGQRVFAKLDALPMPSVAVINGYAFGGGLELALACTFRLATRNAKMGLPEIKLGLIPGYGGTQRLPRIVGEARALEMIMTGRTVGAEEAERIGLVNRLVEGDPVEAGIAFAREFSLYGLPALLFAREAVKRALDLPVSEGLKVEADLSTLAFRTRDAEEGMAAFLEKRKPKFEDR
jgi:enoyl-CoA hydratase